MILVTGGAGFIGSHTCVALAQAGIPFVVLDNFCNSRRSVLERVERIIGAPVSFIEGDIRDTALLQRVFAEHAVEGVIHFAALKSVGESVREPLRYYDNNVAGTVALLGAMRAANVRTLVFSSSATVYGDPASVPIREDFPLSATNAYGWSKLMMEQVLADVDASEPGQWRIARLRYFNPVGAHASGLLVKTRKTFPTICCLTLRRWPWACANNSACTATTTPRPMAPACATTSMCAIWPRVTWPRCATCAATPAC